MLFDESGESWKGLGKKEGYTCTRHFAIAAVPACLMSYEIAKLILEHARSGAERNAAVRTALGMGMPLRQIEEYLDWLDNHASRFEQRLEEDTNDDSARLD